MQDNRTTAPKADDKFVDLFGLHEVRTQALSGLIASAAQDVKEELERHLQSTRESPLLMEFGVNENSLLKKMIEGFKTSYSVSTAVVTSDHLAKEILAFHDQPIDNRDELPSFVKSVSRFLKRPTVLRPRVWRFNVDYLELYHSVASRDYDKLSLAGHQRAAQPILTYFTELFLGRLQDRNGSKITASISIENLDITQLATLSSDVAPKVVGDIITALTEALGDYRFGIPYYCADILSTYREQRNAADAREKNKSARDEAVGFLSDPQKANYAPVSEKVPAYLRDYETGMNLAKLAKCDVASVDIENRRLEAEEAIRNFVNGKSAQQLAFTCVKSGLVGVKEFMSGIFFDNNSIGVIGNDQLVGDDWYKTYDFADLIGAIVTCAARNSYQGFKSVVGGVVRGLTIAGMNNEVLAEVLGSLFGGLAKKAAEAFAFRFLNALVTKNNTGISADERIRILRLLIALYLNGVFTKDERTAIASD